MHKTSIFKLATALLLCGGATLSASAFDASRYAASSKLATGKWVKIAIPRTGVYELTPQQLSQMGFSNPASVRIYGNGGNMMSEVFRNDAPDDLVQVPVQRYGDKICFYAVGPVNMTLTDPAGTAHYTRTRNAYSTAGYYFITEDAGTPDLSVSEASIESTPGSQTRASSLTWFMHEREINSPSLTGKSVLGENLNDQSQFAYNLPQLCPDSLLVVNTCAAASANSISYITTYLNEDGGARDTLNYTLSASRLLVTEGNKSYETNTPFASLRPKTQSQSGTLEVGIYCPNGVVSSQYLDYFIITYYQKNQLPADSSQMQLGIPGLTTRDRIEIASQAGNNLQVWNVNDPSQPQRYTTTVSGNTASFTPGVSVNWLQLVAFDPAATLPSPTSWTAVENQNLHAMAVPHMVILTNPVFAQQAQRIADYHHQHDGMDVAIVYQDQVFNEFSSGTPDAMGVRWFNKMLYDRDNAKFRYELILGCGSFDNRGVVSDKANRVITYASDNSNNEDYSYSTDDFFGYLDDNASSNITAAMLRLGIGRIPSATPDEAKSDVDKLITYMANPDYGVWRNNVMLVGDTRDNYEHTFKADQIGTLIDDELAAQMNIDKVYVPLYPNATANSEPGVAEDSRTATEAHKHMVDLLTSGQYFGTYVGHGAATILTKGNHLWTTTDVNNTNYNHLPIFTTAACDVARWDGGTRGIAEMMFHKKNGGAIALLTSSRQVYSDPNDQLNRAFTRALFSFKANGVMPRLGDAYMKAKQSFGTTSNYNKMKFHLLGDPAMAVNYPKPYFKLTSVNGTQVTNDTLPQITTAPLQKVTITAQVMNAAGTEVNTEFNGDATVTLYDRALFWQSVTNRTDRRSVTHDIYYPRDILAQVTGRVVNGQFTATLVVPRYPAAQNENGLIRLYAHQDNSDEMVNGQYHGLKIAAYDESAAIADQQAPTITEMYLNDQTSFAEGDMVPTASTLYIRATDDLALNVQTGTVNSGMTLQLDGGKTTYREIKDFLNVTDDGKSLAIAFPLSELESGNHSLTFTIYDVAGNAASRTVNFVVGNSGEVTLTANELPAIDKATFNISTELSNPEMTIKVTDATGNLVYSTTTSSFPFTWNLTGNNGQRLKAGLYKYFGTYTAGNNYGGTAIGNLIVMDPYNRAK